jgi:RimJ/RimL family protein N-acetyltransferase
MGKSVQAMLGFCEERLKLHSLYLEVKPHNERAIHIYKKSGFIEAPGSPGQNLMMHYAFAHGTH